MELLKSLIFFLLKHHPIFWEPLEAIQRQLVFGILETSGQAYRKVGLAGPTSPYNFSLK